jgi:hypothetical protein
MRITSTGKYLDGKDTLSRGGTGGQRQARPCVSERAETLELRQNELGPALNGQVHNL